jgi:hypothetical protein
MDVPVGANVSYEKGEGKKGIEAFNVSIMEDEQEDAQTQDYGMAA